MDEEQYISIIVSSTCKWLFSKMISEIKYEFHINIIQISI